MALMLEEKSLDKLKEELNINKKTVFDWRHKILSSLVKDGIYNVQHVNSMHNRLKKWNNEQFWRVSTKYLQQYLNLFRAKEMLKYNKHPVSQLVLQTVIDIKTYARYFQINDNYETLISMQ